MLPSAPLAAFLLALLLASGCSDEPSESTSSGSPTPQDENVVYVDAAASPGGDGSLLHPFQTVREAFETERVHDTVEVAAGVYPVPASWVFEGDLTILGAGPEVTTFASEDDTSRLAWSVGSSLAVMNLDLGSPADFEGGSLRLEDIRSIGAVGPAVSIQGSLAALAHIEVSDVTEVEGSVGTGDGIDITGGSLSFLDGSITGIPDRALILRNVDADIDSLTLESAQRGALTVTEGAKVTASVITIAGVSLGIFADGATLSLSHSSVSDATTAGLLAGSDAMVTVSTSTFSDCPQGHIAIVGGATSLTLEDSTLTNALAGPCVSAGFTTGAVAIRDSVVKGCAGSGISLSGLTGGIIERTEVADVGPDPIFPEIADGISVLDAEVTLTANAVHDTDGIGISLIRVDGTVAENLVGPTEAAGISLIEAGIARMTIRDNTVTSAVGAGILVLAAAADVTGNTVKASRYEQGSALGEGLAFGDLADVTATGNHFLDNARDGILFLDGASGTIDGNESTGNLFYGILELCTGPTNAVTIGTNDLTGNGLGQTYLCSP